MFKYVGKGFIVGIPARDISMEEAVEKEYDMNALQNSGLWKEEKSSKKSAPPKGEDKMVAPSKSNKDEDKSKGKG